MRGIVKRFPGVLANDHVDLTVREGEIHALLGENGAGKSTLMQVLYGLYQRDEGQIFLSGRRVNIGSPKEAIDLGIGMIHQDFMLVPTFSVVENVILGLDEGGSRIGLEMEKAARRVQDLSARHGLEVDPHAVVGHLPVGVQQRVEILKLLCRNARVLILDEPTAVLTPQEVAGLFHVLKSLKAAGHALIFITHKLHEVMEIADRVTVMRGGKVVSTLIASQTDPRQLARLMVGREIAPRRREIGTRRAGDTRLQVEDLHLYDAMGLPKLRGISLRVRAGEILGLAGVDGNGQSELAEAIMGLRPIARGRVLVEGRDVSHAPPAARRAAGMAYIPADRRQVGSVGELSLAYNAILGDHRAFVAHRGWVIDERRVQAHARRLVATYDVRTPGVSFTVRKLSGGNLQKLVLGRELMRKPAVLVAEQPTRGLDVGAIEYVHQQLLAERARGAAILLISAELEEIMQLSDRIAVIYGGQLMGVLDSGQARLEVLGLMMAGTPLPEIEGGEAGHG
jgi:simple sugar transport system ATP-binding protein